MTPDSPRASTRSATPSRSSLRAVPPFRASWLRHARHYHVPRNLNAWYVLGSLALLTLALQVLSGIFLIMHYVPQADGAFESVQRLSRQVPWGWLIRDIHTTGASLLFVVLYLHLFRGLIYGSYQRPRQWVWGIGMMLLVCMMAEAFFGYLLPWGQLSYWGARVILDLVSTTPGIGPGLAAWMQGGSSLTGDTLMRFYALHIVAVPLLIAGLLAAHISSLHAVGANSPLGTDLPPAHGPQPTALTVPLHPFYTVRDLVAAIVFLIVYAAIVLYAPAGGGYVMAYDNFQPANPLVTPPLIRPLWYFSPLYAMLRVATPWFVQRLAWVALAITLILALCLAWTWVRTRRLQATEQHQLAVTPRALGASLLGMALAGVLLRTLPSAFCGALFMTAAIVLPCLLPWLDQASVRALRFRPLSHRALFVLLVLAVLLLAGAGMLDGPVALHGLAQLATGFYLGFFLLMPVWSRLGRYRVVPNPVPNLIPTPVLTPVSVLDLESPHPESPPLASPAPSGKHPETSA